MFEHTVRIIFVPNSVPVRKIILLSSEVANYFLLDTVVQNYENVNPYRQVLGLSELCILLL